MDLHAAFALFFVTMIKRLTPACLWGFSCVRGRVQFLCTQWSNTLWLVVSKMRHYQHMHIMSKVRQQGHKKDLPITSHANITLPRASITACSPRQMTCGHAINNSVKPSSNQEHSGYTMGQDKKTGDRPDWPSDKKWPKPELWLIPPAVGAALVVVEMVWGSLVLW